MMLDLRFAQPFPHHCDPYSTPSDHLSNGTRWICDECGAVRVLWRPRADSLPSWRDETRQERKQRLKADRKERK